MTTDTCWNRLRSGRSLGLLARLVLVSGTVGSALSPGVAAAATDEIYTFGTAFDYQGRLQQNGRAAEGSVDLSFELYDAQTDGNTFGRVDLEDVAVRRGTFSVELDFGRSVYSGDPVWLEISVRAAGQGEYTTLDPRHRLAGEAISACVVNGDVAVNGKIAVDPPGASPGLSVACCNDEGSGGQILLNGFLGAMALDDNEIQARTLGNPSRLTINGDGGDVGIGVASPVSPLTLPGSPDVSPGAGGVLVIGSPSGQSVAFDSNEIMARSNGAVSTLYLNAEGGTVVFGGPVDIGYQIVSHREADNIVEVFCPAGLRVLGGGCHTSDNLTSPDLLIESKPSGSTGWWCFYDDQSGNEVTAYAICANVR